MKTYSKLIILALILFMVNACKEEYIDPLSKVDPGPDESAPVVNIAYPVEGTEIKVVDDVTAINIEFEVSDDIEIGSISISLDGTEIARYDEFKDYRRFVGEYHYDNLTTGAHILTITATDIDGKNTSVTKNFSKVPPYVPVFDGEIFYMPFDGDYMDLVTIKTATKVGSPGFAGQSVQGLNAYAGATGGYLTFPTEGLTNNEFSASFWMKINAVPDRAGILVMGPVDEANPTAMNNRKSGFRFFRENAGGMQRFKLNVGNGTADAWFDGGAAADVNPSAGDWVHLAFTISDTKSAVYINGEVVSQGAFTGVDWAGCDVLSIMSGAPRFTGWNHHSDLSYMDELRLFNKELTIEEVKMVMGFDKPYEPKYDGEIFYLPFDGTYMERIGKTVATEVGTPGFAGQGVAGGESYAGAADSYLTFPTDGLTGGAFSAVFWMKINATPDRAGILVIGPPDPDKPATPNNRKNGFRFFRENANGMQRFKLNVGNGTADTWVDGGTAADVDPGANEWVHFGFTISATKAVVYINGVPVKESDITGIDWTGCDILSIMSGAPRFTEWNHLSDQSYMDELRLFNKTLTQAEIQATMN